MAEPGTLVRAIRLLGETLGALETAVSAPRAASTLRRAWRQCDTGAGERFRRCGAAGRGGGLGAGRGCRRSGRGARCRRHGGGRRGSLSAIERIATIVSAIDDLQPAVAGIGLPAAVAGDLANRLFNLALVEALDRAGLTEVLALLGVLRSEVVNSGSGDPDLPPHVLSSFDFGRLGDWIDNPVDALAAEYGWGGGGFDAEALLHRVAAILLHYGPGGFIDPDAPTPAIDAGFFELHPRDDIAPPGLALELRQSVSPGAIELGGSDFTATLNPRVELPFGLTVTLRPPFALDAQVQGGILPNGEVTFTLAADRTQAAEPFVIFGEPDTSRMSFRRLAVEGSLRFSGADLIPALRTEIAEGKLVIGTGEADGFVKTILDGVKLESDFDLGIGISADHGVFFEGSSSLEVQLPLHVSLGPVDVSAFTITLGIDGARFPLSLGADVKATLGPLVAVVRELGVTTVFRLSDEGDGNAGPLDVTIGFKPPTGVGLSIDAGAVKGGGLLNIDPERGEYAGMLQLSILELVTVTAIGVINTKLPDNSEGFSFVAIISVEFNPGIQLGFGFTLIGVGGLVGLNRSVDLDALASGARSGSIDTILFPKDIIANATKIISDIRIIFPPEDETFLIGPMTKFGWGTPTLISLSLGIIIEVPGNFAIVGKLTVAIPDERAPLIIIQVAFIGAIEFNKKRGWFFAILYDSRVIYMTLEGGMGVLAAFGSDANFIVTVGGFHPSYNPPALPFPDIPRIAINILNTPVAKVIVTAYFAVTSNTVQFGAHANLYFGIKIASIEGHIGFDALFQFSPFYFTITISASLSVKLFGAGLFSVSFRGTLEGTSPWHIEGTGSISLLFWDVHVDFSKTWGDKEDTTLPPIEVLPILAAEFEKVENWTARLENSNSLRVTLRTIDPSIELVLHPVGTLAITQRAVPLAITLDKVGSQRPSDANRFSIDAATVGIEKRGVIEESFAIGQFQNKTDDQKLSAADYEKEEAGLNLSVTGSQTKTSFMTKRVARYEKIIIDTNFLRLFLDISALISGLFTHFLAANAVARAPISFRSRDRKHLFDDKIAVMPNGYVVANQADNSPLAGAPVSFQSRARAEEFLAQQTRADPSIAERAHILRAHELRQAA